MPSRLGDLGRHAPEPGPDYLRLRELIDRMRDDPSLVRVEQLPELVEWSPRTMQRHFRQTVGVSAKWVLAWYSLQEAAVEPERDPGTHDQLCRGVLIVRELRPL